MTIFKNPDCIRNYARSNLRYFEHVGVRFTEKPSTNHILWNKSHVTNNDAAENFLVWFEQNSLQVGREEKADKDIFNLSQDSKTSCHLLLSYTELPTNALDSKQEHKNRLTCYKTDSKWKEN